MMPCLNNCKTCDFNENSFISCPMEGALKTASMEKRATWEQVKTKGRLILENGGVEIQSSPESGRGAWFALVDSSTVLGNPKNPLPTIGDIYDVIVATGGWEGESDKPKNVGGWIQWAGCNCLWGSRMMESNTKWRDRICSHIYATILKINKENRLPNKFVGDRRGSVMKNKESATSTDIALKDGHELEYQCELCNTLTNDGYFTWSEFHDLDKRFFCKDCINGLLSGGEYVDNGDTFMISHEGEEEIIKYQKVGNMRKNAVESRFVSHWDMDYYVIDYNIYQILDSESSYLFMGHDFAMKHGFNFGDYSLVYSGELRTTEGYHSDKSICEDIYKILNMKHPRDYHARSLSMSDIVEIDNRFFYVDRIGFVEINPNDRGKNTCPSFEYFDYEEQESDILGEVIQSYSYFKSYMGGYIMWCVQKITNDDKWGWFVSGSDIEARSSSYFVTPEEAYDDMISGYKVAKAQKKSSNCIPKRRAFRSPYESSLYGIVDDAVFDIMEEYKWYDYIDEDLLVNMVDIYGSYLDDDDFESAVMMTYEELKAHGYKYVSKPNGGYYSA